MAILVLGGAGYIGSHMVDRLVNEGQEKVVVVDSLVTGHRAAVHPDAVFYQGDLADQDFMRTVFKEHADIDAVIHFAAYSLVAESMADPLKYFDNNTAGMVKLLEVMHECGVHYIVFSSTAATYGIPEEIPILETTPQKPINPYGESKLMMETIMRWADQPMAIKYVPLRYFNVAGAKPDAATKASKSNSVLGSMSTASLLVAAVSSVGCGCCWLIVGVATVSGVSVSVFCGVGVANNCSLSMKEDVIGWHGQRSSVRNPCKLHQNLSAPVFLQAIAGP